MKVRDTKYLLDTNVIILAVEGLNETLLVRLQNTSIDTLTTSAICLAEVLRGASMTTIPGYDMFFQQLSIIPFGEEAAAAYATVPFKRARFDRLIGAHALALGATLVTVNVSDFADIDGLAIEDWTR